VLSEAVENPDKTPLWAKITRAAATSPKMAASVDTKCKVVCDGLMQFEKDDSITASVFTKASANLSTD
jgi:hypothetical protein